MTDTTGAAPAPGTGLLDGLAMAAVAADPDGLITFLNPAAATLFGRDVRLGDDVRAIGGADLRGAVDEVLRLVLTTGSWAGELSLVRAGGESAAMATSWTVVEADGSTTGVLLLVEDSGPHAGLSSQPLVDGLVTGSSRPGARRLHRLSAVISELLAVDSIEAVAKVVTEHMTDAAGATIGSISLLLDSDTLELVGIRGGTEGVKERWATYPVSGNNPGSEAVRSGEPVVAVGRDEIAERYPELEQAAEGERSIVCLPLVAAGGRRLGVVSLSFPGLWRVDEAEALFLRVLADTLALTVDRLQAQRDAEDREAKLRFLAETSARLAEDLDYEATLVAVAEAAVPWFADWCSIALEEDGLLRTLSVAHANPDMVAFVEELQTRYPPKPDPTQGSYKVLATGVSDFVPEVPDELLEMAAEDEEHLRLLRKLELRGGLSCPLKVRDRVLGVVTWASSSGGRRFTAEDLAFGEDLARRAAVAIDNAQLHSQVRDVALELQRAVLPDQLPDIPGWTTTACYLPAGRTDAGGDFYDVVPLADGRLAMFVGDVMGRGVQAASVMAQMRAAIRTLVAVDPNPADLMSGMDRGFETLHVEQLVTMVYALADPALDSVAVTSAGHPEPMLRRATGEVELLSQTSTLILGAGGGRRSVLTTDLGPGDALLMYTDGLVERRGGDNESALLDLLAAMPAAADPLEWLEGVVEEVRDPTRDDDVAALLLIRDPV